MTLLSLVLGGALLLTGCSEWGPAGGDRSGGTMTVSLAAVPDTWDPDSAAGTPSAQPVRDVEAPLLQLTPHTQRPAPGLARSWKYDASRTRLTLTLRPKAEFSNGHDVTAEDVVFSVDQWREGTQHGAFYSGLISGATAHGAHTVVLDLPAPSSELVDALTLTSSAVVPNHFGGRSATAFYARPVGAGPFRIGSTSTDRVDLVRNKHFYDQTHPLLDHLDYTTATPQVALHQVAVGRTDLAEEVPAVDLTGAHGHARLLSTPSQSTSLLTFSPKAAATRNPELRKAVSLAIDRSSLVRSVYDGKADVAPGLLPGTTSGAAACTGCRWSALDVGQAEKDLASVPGHHHLTLLVDAGDPVDVRTAQAITPMLAQAGVTVRTLPVGSGTLAGRVASGGYEMALRTLSAQTPSPAEPLQALLTGHYLAGGDAQTAADDALRAVDAATDSDGTTAAVNTFEQQSFDTAAAVPLVEPDVVDVVAGKVRGLTVAPSGLFHSSGLWLKK